MSDHLSVVPLHDGRPPLNDVVRRLRLLADQIEAGEIEDVTGAFVLLPMSNDFPAVFGFGDVEGENHPIIIFELAKAMLVNNIASRD